MVDLAESSLMSNRNDVEGNTRNTASEIPKGGNRKNASRCSKICRKLGRDGFTNIELEFLGIAAVITVVLLVFSCIRIHQLTTSHKAYASALVMLISEAFCQYYIIHGVLLKRPYEIIFYIIVIFLDVIYCTVDFVNIESPNTFEKVRLGIDWSMGSIFPSILGYYIVSRIYLKDKDTQDEDAQDKDTQDKDTQDKDTHIVSRTYSKNEATARNVELERILGSFLVLDLQLGVCYVIFIVTDRVVDANGGVFVGVLVIANALFFGIGCKVHKLCCIPSKCKCEMHEIVPFILFYICGGILFAFFINKTNEQREGIGNAAYPDLVTLAFGIAAVITRVVIYAFSITLVVRKFGGQSTSGVAGNNEETTLPGNDIELTALRTEGRESSKRDTSQTVPKQVAKVPGTRRNAE